MLVDLPALLGRELFKPFQMYQRLKNVVQLYKSVNISLSLSGDHSFEDLFKSVVVNAPSPVTPFVIRIPLARYIYIPAL